MPSNDTAISPRLSRLFLFRRSNSYIPRIMLKTINRDQKKSQAQAQYIRYSESDPRLYIVMGVQGWARRQVAKSLATDNSFEYSFGATDGHKKMKADCSLVVEGDFFAPEDRRGLIERAKFLRLPYVVICSVDTLANLVKDNAGRLSGSVVKKQFERMRMPSFDESKVVLMVDSSSDEECSGRVFSANLETHTYETYQRDPRQNCIGRTAVGMGASLQAAR